MQVKNKAGKSLGLEVEPCKNSLGLVILDVKAGYRCHGWRKSCTS